MKRMIISAAALVLLGGALGASAQTVAPAGQPAPTGQGTVAKTPAAGVNGAGSSAGTAPAPSTTTANNNEAITADQKANIRQAIIAEKAEPAANVTFTVSVGTAVPKTMALRKLPARVVQLMPGWKDYQYFVLADGRIVLVDPMALKIVTIVTA